MQKQSAQPHSFKSPDLSSCQDSFPPIQSLNLNQRSQSVAQTQDDNTKKLVCSIDHQFLKTKPIEKKTRKFQKQQTKKKHNYQKKVQHLQHKIQELQKQIASLRRKQMFCPQCRYNLFQNQTPGPQLIIPQINFNVAGSYDDRRSSKQSVQFQKINFMSPLMFSQQMEEKSWIFLGTMLIAMGSKIMDVDGTINVFKVLKQSVDSIRRQVQKCQKKINLDFYLSKQEIGGSQVQAFEGFNIDPFFAKHEQVLANAGFQLQGVKLQSVDQNDLFYDQKVNFSVNYQALITIMEYLRQHCQIG